MPSSTRSSSICSTSAAARRSCAFRRRVAARRTHRLDRPRRIRHGCGCRRYRSCRRARCGSDRRYRRREEALLSLSPCAPSRDTTTIARRDGHSCLTVRGLVCGRANPRGRHRARRARFPARAAPAPGTATDVIGREPRRCAGPCGSVLNGIQRAGQIGRNHRGR